MKSSPAPPVPVTLTKPAAVSAIVPSSRYTPWFNSLPAKPPEPPVPATVTPPPAERTAASVPKTNTPWLPSSPAPPVPATLTKPAAVSAITPPLITYTP
ncbi:hypothetical protein LzC2_26360 [Planctomycetes bacterium LzC2]|uniref:Uncharacterized protein n=1 Tax=Alienimonas chondri TaxID=2681879 RepID=A0ABX1VEP1_9PLAN|nr:hypothetical protein [Alienimonas chondri]